jgi:hypothetical protein
MGIAIFGVLAIVSLGMGDHFTLSYGLFAAIAGLMGFFAVFCLYKLKYIEYAGQSLKMERLRDGLVMMVVVLLPLDIWLFASAFISFNNDRALGVLNKLFPIILVLTLISFLVFGIRSMKFFPEVKKSQKIAVLVVFLTLALISVGMWVIVGNIVLRK